MRKRNVMAALLGICVLLAFSLGGSMKNALGGDRGTEESRGPKRTVKITLKEHYFYAGDSPLFLSAYNASGQRLPGLSGDWTQVEIDVSEIPEGQYVPLAVQKDQLAGNNLISICKGKHTRFVIDEAGIIHPKSETKKDKEGPFLRLTLFRKEGVEKKEVDLTTLALALTIDKSGQKLSAAVSPDKKIVVKNAPREPVTLTLKDLASEKTIKIGIFPYLRASSPDIIDCEVYDVTVGKLKPGE